MFISLCLDFKGDVIYRLEGRVYHFSFCLKKDKIKGEHTKNLGLCLDYGGIVALYAEGNILQ